MSARAAVRGHTRRAFLGGVGMTVAAAVALTLAPGIRTLALPGGTAVLPPVLTGAAEGDWHVDDICGHMPRYAHPIPCMHEATAPDLRAFAAPADWQFVA